MSLVEIRVTQPRLSRRAQATIALKAEQQQNTHLSHHLRYHHYLALQHQRHQRRQHPQYPAVCLSSVRLSPRYITTIQRSQTRRTLAVRLHPLQHSRPHLFLPLPHQCRELISNHKRLTNLICLPF